MRLFSLDHSDGFTWPCFSFRKALMIGNNSKLCTWGRSFSCTHNFGSVIRAFSQGCFSACLCFWCALSFTAAHWLTHRKKKCCVTSALLIAAQTQTSKSRISKPPTTHVWDQREGQKTVACRCTRAAKLFQGAEVELTCCATVTAVDPSVDLCVLLGEDSWKMFRPLSRRRPQVFWRVDETSSRKPHQVTHGDQHLDNSDLEDVESTHTLCYWMLPSDFGIGRDERKCTSSRQKHKHPRLLQLSSNFLSRQQ